ncbi:hypothetical protein GEV43_36480 [Actinomadura sp. J1-007]|nr:hypothetical protein [Actinomadura sp. J1-007]
MVVTLDVEGARASHFVAGTSPLAELMACLHTLAEPEHHPESREWLARVRDGLPGTLVQALNYHAPLWARYRCRLFYPVQPPLDRSLPAELDALRRLDPRTFAQLAAYAIRGMTFAGAGEIAGGAAQRSFIRASERHSFSRGSWPAPWWTTPSGSATGSSRRSNGARRRSSTPSGAASGPA